MTAARDPQLMPGATPPALAAYLREFDALAHQLPRGPRHDLRGRVWTHCAEAVGRVPASGEAPDEQVRVALSELGEPAALVAGELDRAGLRPNPFRPVDTAPIHLLGASILAPVLGAAVGLVLLWRSRVWRRRDKLVATLLVALAPVALLPVLAVVPALVVGLVGLGPAAAAVHLVIVRALAMRALAVR